MTTRANLSVGIIGSTARAVIWVALGAFAVGAVGATRNALAQQPAQPSADDSKVLTKDELATLVGKIALYPDDLVAIVLPASTYPLQVVEAARFLEERKKDSGLKPNDKWDDSVVALLNYPEVVKLMNADLDWTWKLGDAVINQRGDVLDAIQSFRDRAYAAGNLKSDEHQVVQNDDGDIAIKPADPQVVYVPYYEPSSVVVYQSEPVYHYYPWGYPLYYYPYPYGYPFGFGFFWGVTSAFVIGWHSHYVHYYPCGYYGHPYYGHTYYNPLYVRTAVNVNVNVSHGNYVWQPHYVHGGQPFTRSDGRQLAIARHDGSGGGAPSGYRTVDRGGSNSFRDDHGERAPGGNRADHRDDGVANGHRGDGVANGHRGDGTDNGHHNGVGNGHRSDGTDNGRGNDGTDNGHHNGVGNGHRGDGTDNGRSNDGANNGHHDGVANGQRDGDRAAPIYGTTRTIQPVTDRVTAQSFRDELRARESGHASFAQQNSGQARDYRSGDYTAARSGAARDGVRTIQPVPNRATAQSFRDDLHARESGSTFAQPYSGQARQNGGSTLERQHGSGNVERHTEIPQQEGRYAYPQQAPDHSYALRSAPPVRVAPTPAPYSAPRMAPSRPSGGDVYANRVPHSAPQRGDGGAPSGHQGGGSAGHAQGHAFSGRGGNAFR